MPPRPRKRSPLLPRAVALLTLGAAGVCVWLFARHYEAVPSTDNAYVQADLVRVAPRVGGPVETIAVRDNQAVRAGDLLFAIDPTDFQVRLEQARGQLAVDEAKVAQAQAAITQAEAQVAQAGDSIAQSQALTARAQQDFNRAGNLFRSEQRAISKQDVDAARAGIDSATANLNAARSAEAGSRANLEAARANLAAAAAQARVGAAAVRDAELQLSYTRVLAPVDGVVTNLNLPPGNFLPAGQSPLTLVAAGTWRALAYFKETQLARMRPGQAVEVRLFSYGEHRFRGVVQGVGWGIYQPDGSASANTAQLPNVSPTVNWVRLAQRFPVRIDLPETDPQRPFRIGQTAVVRVDTLSAGQGSTR